MSADAHAEALSEGQLVRRWAALAWRGSGGALAAIGVLTLASAALLAGLPWLWQYLIDAVRADAEPVRLQELALWMMAVGLGHATVYLALQCLRAVVNARIEQRARTAVFDHLSELDPAFFRAWRTGDLVTRLYDDAGDKIAWFLCSGIFRAVEAVCVVVACLAAMCFIDRGLTAVVVLPLPLLIVGQGLTQAALGRRYAAVQGAISRINDELATTFGGIRIVQAARLAPAARARFVAAGEASRDAEIHAARVQQTVFLMYGYGWQLAVVALLIAGGGRVIDGALSLGEYVALEGFVMTLVWPMFDLGMFVSKYKQASVALRRLQELMDVQPRASAGAEPADGALVARQAGVVAGDGAQLLAEVSLRAEPGRTLAVVGEVGAGKSVLMQLLAGDRAPTDGAVALGGAAVRAVAPAPRARALAWVPQDPVLLSASLRDNILLGREVSDDDLDHALLVSRLAQDLPALPDGLETRVGERGVTLSGGQQQRVALARALVGRPDLLLLDDATAALDADTEAAFWDALAAERPGLGAVVSTHRVATLRRADHILVLAGGRIVQEGRHDALVAGEGPYRRIYGRYRAREQVEA